MSDDYAQEWEDYVANPPEASDCPDARAAVLALWPAIKAAGIRQPSVASGNENGFGADWQHGARYVGLDYDIEVLEGEEHLSWWSFVVGECGTVRGADITDGDVTELIAELIAAGYKREETTDAM